ncbi:MAG: FAD binding domain-containing protein [Acidimicrobiia bacterium]
MSYDYHRPATLEEALRLATEIPGSRFIAGGTDLLVPESNGRLAPPALISLRRLPELGDISVSDRVRIGATVPLTDILAHPEISTRYPALAASIRVLGSPQIRNVATLGGNLCNASPAADTAPALLAYAATVEIRGLEATRELPLEDFFLGPGETALQPGEILTAVWLAPPAEGARSVFLRQGRVTMDLAIASVAAFARFDGASFTGVRLAAGAVAPTPVRLRRTEAVVEGTSLDSGIRAEAAKIAREEISPISDLRSSASYRTHLTGVFVERALIALTEETPR